MVGLGQTIKIAALAATAYYVAGARSMMTPAQDASRTNQGTPSMVP